MNLEILKRFCSTEERYKHRGFDVPFSKGEWTYATDDCLCIRVPRQTDNEKGPNAEKLFNEALLRPATVWQPLPAFELVFTACIFCDGAGYVKYCPDADNEKCRNGESTRCKKYNDECQIGCKPTDKGALPCEDCDGAGKIPDSGNIIIDGSEGVKVRVSAIFLDKIKDLPNVQIAPYTAEAPILIKFDGGEGILMPMRI